MKEVISKYPIFFILLLCLLSRIPQLTSPHLVLDGDECVVGLMSKHMLQNKESPLFFWGQAYGLTTIECIFILPFYLTMGISVLSVKLAMLVLWMMGVVFFYKTFFVISAGNKKLSVILTLFLILNPAWAVWSMKARGGYLTAFTLSSFATLLLFHPNYRHKKATYIITGILAAIVFESQKLWLPGIIVFAAYNMLRQKRVSYFLIFTSLFAITIFAFYCITDNAQPTYNPPIATNREVLINNLLRIPYYLYASMQGNYYLEEIQSPNLFCAIFALSASILVGVLLFISSYYLVLRKRHFALFIVSILPIAVVLIATIFIWSITPRYLLPICGSALISACLFFQACKATHPLYRLLTSQYIPVLLFTGCVAITTFYSYSFRPSTERSFASLYSTLKKNGVKYVVCTDELLTWQIIFHSNEAIISRPVWVFDRYLPYTMAVDSAISKKRTVAIVGYDNNRIGLDFKEVVSQDEFFICINPPHDVVSTRRSHIW